MITPQATNKSINKNWQKIFQILPETLEIDNNINGNSVNIIADFEPGIDRKYNEPIDLNQKKSNPAKKQFNKSKNIKNSKNSDNSNNNNYYYYRTRGDTCTCKICT